jgi:hypothetical protein
MLGTPRHFWAHDAVDLCHPWAHSVVVLAMPMMPSSLWCLRACDAVKPVPSLSPQHCHPPRARKATLYIFLCHFGPTNLDFDMLYCHIALICYIAFVLLHCFDVLNCHIALICYIAFNMLHCFHMLDCFWFAALLWYATLLLFCCIASMCYIATLPWYATMLLICCIALICYIATLLNDESGLSEMSVATWTNIIVLLRF